VNPEHFLNWQQDPAGNFLARMVFPEKSWELRIQVDMVVELRTVNPFDFFLEPEANRFPFAYPEELLDDLAIYRAANVQEPELDQWVEQIRKEVIKPDISTVDILVEINQFVANRVGYVIRMEPGIQSCQTTIQSGKGSCRDSSFLLMHLLRKLGLASRFCSGYLIQLKADELPRKGPAGPDQDFTDLHAWAEVYLPGAGWIGLDPTSGLLTGEGHIPLFSAAEPSRAAPVSGATDPCQSTLHFEMKVERLQEAPRTTKPYRDGLFEGFRKIVPVIDRKLNQLDMRLTMGGEPTFVSDDDFDGPEWNFQAMAPDGDKKKRDYAERLRSRLVHNLALPSPLFIAGQGKWYPGEPLPRWAYFAHWRLDGQPMSLLYADSLERSRATGQDARDLLEKLCQRLKLDPAFLQPLHEDPLELLRSEAALPENAKKLKDLDSFHGLERNRVLQLLEEDLSSPRAYVLPLAYEPESQRWSSSVWKTRRSQLFLHPGDSPAGLRLPLGSLGDGFRSVYLEDPTELTAHLPDPEHLLKVHKGYSLKDDRKRDPLRVALVVEERNEKLHIFLPPPSSVFSHLSLIAHLESCLKDMAVEYVWEGHPPPMHPGLSHLSITPDPGVLEVNLQPSETLEESARITQVLYRSAKEEGLTTQKFMIDGRPAATGGGNHITLGARSTLESPFLRFPSLLPSLIVYWQKHPALSYLFSGLFIGPTSQAPRIDEARIDTLYDLELALKKLYSYEGDCPPYMIDRLLRHHLTDLTGNTHRAEFCIDKLYDPGSLGGRRGLLEMRAFEMPPHWKMSAVQQALIGAILCLMRKHPPEPKLVRWGLDLRDRFMIPHYIQQDLQEVLDDLKSIDLDFSMELFEPFFEFRFPVYGEVHYPGIRIELRMGLEPWNVLGEEAHTGGTSRAVDSATERMQISVEGDPAERYELACNGQRVPLKKVSPDKRVAGVRYKAWNPASTMHPHIKPHNPLVFSLFDTYNERYVTGCTYHVAHPGGRSYDTLPVNALEAESRRINRFQAGDFGSSSAPAPAGISNPEFPCTLDLRLAAELPEQLSDS
tara:strand:+ start:7322 stop:10477 length:3156 start_codon:yes stop_codon:yes gene_type:complete